MPLESVAVSPEVSSSFHQPSGRLALRSPGKAATIGADTPYPCVPPTLPLTVTVPDRLCATDNGAAPVAVSACTGCAPTIRNAAQRRAAALHAPTAGVLVDDGRPDSLNGAILPPFEDAPPPATGNLWRASQTAPSPRHAVSGGLSMPDRILSGDIEHTLGQRPLALGGDCAGPNGDTRHRLGSIPKRGRHLRQSINRCQPSRSPPWSACR